MTQKNDDNLKPITPSEGLRVKEFIKKHPEMKITDEEIGAFEDWFNSQLRSKS